MKRPFKTLLAVAASALIATSAVAQEPKPGGDLVMSLVAFPAHFINAMASGGNHMIPGAQFFASPVMTDSDGNPQPYLAESWELSDDGLSLTLNLVQNATFHDGEPLTSKDVAFSVMLVRDNHPFSAMLGPVTSVDTPDDYTAIIRMSGPHPALMMALGPPFMPIMPAHIYDDGTPIREHSRINENVVGSGPFKLGAVETDVQFVLERFDDFFIEGRPLLDNIIVTVDADPQTAILGVENGTIHIIPELSSVDMIARADASDAMEIDRDGLKALGPLDWITMNNAIEPYNDLRVRQAIAHAIDTNFIVDVLHEGLSQVGGPIHSGFSSSAPDRWVTYEFDLEKAEALLDEAGYPRGDDGVRFRTTIDYLPGLPDSGRSIAEYVKPALKKIGIEVDIVVSPDYATWAKTMSDKTFEMSTDGVYSWGDPIIGNHRTFLSDNIRSAPFTNTTQYQNPEVDALLNAAAVEIDEDKRNALYADFQEIVTRDVPMVFLTETAVYMAYSKDVQGFPASVWGGAYPFLDVWLSE
ncbi:ABC transporter substrate-binding protein [Yoonia sp. SS1-5]|uniref:ABC transporter substrate-binding protein n=1 Tax=Yoonia rhodophyticola TaxID=3137370 RepID=A0AAN0MKM7_9RHOB